MNPILAAPLADALADGADSRSQLTPAGINKYGTSTEPNDVVPFGSCTSSTVSPRGYAAAARLQETLQNARHPGSVAHGTANTIRRRLRQVLRLPNDVEIALAPSGTDAELLALALVGGEPQRPIVNIIVGPNEVGSGTPNAAAGLVYDPVLPSGRTATVGDPIDPQLAACTQLVVVPLRHSDGTMLEEAELDALVDTHVDEAIRSGARVLLHVVAHSKTGVHAPSLQCVRELQTRYDDLTVMVDAAQGRFSRKGMRQAIEQQHLFMITGSKFFGGPPFSGALCVPSAAVRRLPNALREFPTSFRDYFCQLEMPAAWRRTRRNLRADINYGLLLRWTAALAEIEAYYHAPSDARLQVMRFFEQAVPRLFMDSPHLELLTVSPPVYGEERLLQSKTTVFNFRIRSADGQYSGLDELRTAHRRLLEGTDESQSRFHLGQPVRIGDDRYALRVAIGGELIVRLSTDSRLGSTLQQRLDWLEEKLQDLRTSLDAFARTPSASSTT